MSMNATNRSGKDRIANDAYFTPQVVADACVRRTLARMAPPKLVVEPSMGGGAFVHAIRRQAPQAIVWGIDIQIDETAASVCHEFVRGDWLEIPPAAFYDVDLIVGNPPYKDAIPHIEHALKTAKRGSVAMLLRLAILEGKGRAAFWREHPPTFVHVLTRRPSFVKGATDSAAYAWIEWRNPPRMAANGFEKLPPVLGWLDW